MKETEAQVRDFDDFFQAEYDGVLRALTLAFHDRQRAEEAAQDAFATAYRRWRTVSRTDRPGTWVYVVALRAECRRGRPRRCPPAARAAPRARRRRRRCRACVRRRAAHRFDGHA